MVRRGPAARIGPFLLAIATLTLSAVLPTAGAASPPRPGTALAGAGRVLLALGDSLAAGYQPVDGTTPPKPDPLTGYADAGYAAGYAADLASHEGLRLVDLACPGETTTSMRATPAQIACAHLYKAEFGVTSQESAALAYLGKHRGSVALLTIDIGANDLSRCTGTVTEVNLSCVASAEKTILSNLPALLQPLEQAIHSEDPGTPMVAMTYYDPFLGLVVDPGGTAATASAASSLLAVTALNSQLRTLYGRAGMLVANVAGAFDTNSALPLGRVGTKIVPRNVAEICQLTWMCPAPGSAARPDIHPTTAGYRVIAASFETTVPASR